MTQTAVGDERLNSLVEFAGLLADEARRVTTKYFRTPVVAEIKPDASPVSIADREVEAVIRGMIEEAYPDHGIFGEEEAPVRIDARHVWVIDPIDGTQNFIDGVPHFAVLVGLQLDGLPVLGLVHASMLGALDGPPEQQGLSWWGGPGLGAWKGPGTTRDSTRAQQLKSRPCPRLEEAFVTHGGLKHIQSAGLWDPFTDIIASSRRNRGYGDWLGHMLVAEGVCDGMVDPRVALYDLAAVEPILLAAGSVLIASEPLPLQDGFLGQAVSGTEHIAGELAERLGF